MVFHKSIFDMKNFINAEPDIETSFKNATRYNIPEGFKEFKNLFENLI